VTAASTDAQSGVASVGFPAVFGGDSAAATSSPYSTDYTWSASDTASGAKSVTVTNGAGLTATDTFTVTPDTNPATKTFSNPDKFQLRSVGKDGKPGTGDDIRASY
jgi:hypothetical protein